MQRFYILSGLWQPFTQKRPSLYAASACFYILLSIFPSALFFLSLLPYLPVTLENLMQIMETIIPKQFLPLTEYVLKTVANSDTAAILSISAIFTLWSASKGVLAIMDGLNAVLGLNQMEGYIRRRVIAIIYFLLLSISLLLTLCLHVFGQQILSACIRLFPHLSNLWYFILDLRFLYTIIFLSGLFSLVYLVFPTKKLSFHDCWIGGIAASVGWVIFSGLFSFYVNQISNYEALYGNISILIFICIWLHICILLLLYGGILSNLQQNGSYHPFQILKKAFSLDRS